MPQSIAPEGVSPDLDPATGLTALASMVFDIFVTTLALSAIIGLRYFAVAAVTHLLLWTGKRRGRQRP